MRLARTDFQLIDASLKLPRAPKLQGRSARSIDGGGDNNRSYYCYANPNDFGCNPAYIAAAVMSSLLIVTALLGVIIFLCVRHANAKRLLRVQAQLGAQERAIFTVQQQQQLQQHQLAGGYPMSLMLLPEPPPYSCQDYTLPLDSAAYPPPPYEEQPLAGLGSVSSVLTRLFSARRSRPATSTGRASAAAVAAALATNSPVGSGASPAAVAAGGSATVASESRRQSTSDPNKPPPGFARSGPRDDLPPVS